MIFSRLGTVNCLLHPFFIPPFPQVNLNQISSVVLHTERSLEKTAKGERLPPACCGGVWFTINGPRVAWGRALRAMTDAETQKPGTLVYGGGENSGSEWLSPADLCGFVFKFFFFWGGGLGWVWIGVGGLGIFARAGNLNDKVEVWVQTWGIWGAFSSQQAIDLALHQLQLTCSSATF